MINCEGKILAEDHTCFLNCDRAYARYETGPFSVSVTAEYRKRPIYLCEVCILPFIASRIEVRTIERSKK